MIFYLVLTCFLIDGIFIESALAKEKQTWCFGVTQFDECEGKDVGNYSLVENWIRDEFCSFNSNKNQGSDLVQIKSNGERAVNGLRFLVGNLSPAGSMTRAEAIFFATNGPLQGKYVYFKLIFISELFLKKCSSVLGYSYVTTQVAEMLIADNLDINVLLAPKDAMEVFKKGSKTYCRGLGVYM